MKFKKAIILLTSLLLTFTAVNAQEPVNLYEPLMTDSNEVIFKHATTKIDIIDPSFTAGYYPGGRGPNKLVIYTPNYGLHTGTNEFGTEAIVEGNVVTSISGADSTIPIDGIVISGHGSAKNWITQNIKVGSKVYIDIINQTLTAYTTSDSYIYEAKIKISEAQKIIDYYKLTDINYNFRKPQNHIQSAENYLKIAEGQKQHGGAIKQYTQEAIDEANMALKTALPYMPNELKGVWIRPTQHSENEIADTLETLKDNGFDTVFLETYYHGRTIFPSKTMDRYGFVVQNEDFEGFDPLAIWINQAHKRNMKVHIWFQSFYVGNKPVNSNPRNILAVHPEWGNKTKQHADDYGATKSVSEHNGYFLDPANPDVQDFLEELIGEIIDRYEPDGINLDYIRYPNSNPGNSATAWGFTEYARNNFQDMYGVDPITLTTADIGWGDWNRYRRNKITHFVRKIGKIGKEHHTYISAVIFPDIKSALGTKQQDWRTWSKENYINGFTPLFLTYDSQMLSSMMNDVISVKSPDTELFAGLFVTFMGGSSEDLIKQIFETRKMKADGVILFDYAHTTPVYTDALLASAFNSRKSSSSQIAKVKKKSFSQETENKTDKRKVITRTNSKGFWVYTKE